MLVDHTDPQKCAKTDGHASGSEHKAYVDTCGIVGHWLYVLIASRRFGLYTSSNTFTCTTSNMLMSSE